MPTLTRWYIKSALIYFVAALLLGFVLALPTSINLPEVIRTAFMYLLLGFTVGALLLWHKGAPLHPALWGWLPAHIEFLLIGWIVQLTMGVAFWILPRYWQKERRGKEIYVQIAFVLLNVGIWLVVAYSVFQANRLFLLIGRGAEIGAAVFFAVHAWGRTLSREGAKP